MNQQKKKFSPYTIQKSTNNTLSHANKQTQSPHASLHHRHHLSFTQAPISDSLQPLNPATLSQPSSPPPHLRQQPVVMQNQLFMHADNPTHSLSGVGGTLGGNWPATSPSIMTAGAASVSNRLDARRKQISAVKSQSFRRTNNSAVAGQAHGTSSTTGSLVRKMQQAGVGPVPDPVPQYNSLSGSAGVGSKLHGRYGSDLDAAK